MGAGRRAYRVAVEGRAMASEPGQIAGSAASRMVEQRQDAVFEQ